MKKINLKYPLLVEGNYDKNRVLAVANGTVITLNGFSLFNNEEKKALLRRISEEEKLLVLTDSDGAGFLIRNKLKGYLKSDSVINIYSPQIIGKEKRKKSPSKAGFLGVEGLSDEVLLKILVPFSKDSEKNAEFEEVTAAMLYKNGLTGKDNSATIRNKFCQASNLPENMGAKPLREAINILGGKAFYLKILSEIQK